MIEYYSCPSCEGVWYFQREHCPSCGGRPPETLVSEGTGTVAAATLVHRAPTPELREFAPYLIVLVDLDEGFRVMAHGEPELEIGDRVQAHELDFAGRSVPYFAES